MVYKDILNKMIDEFVDRKEDLVRELHTCPSGELHVSPRNGKYYYYQYIPRSGNRKKTVRKGISKDHEKVMQLVRKRYIQNALKNLDEDIRAAESMLSQYKPFDENSVMEKYIGKYPQLAEGIYHGCISDKEWSEDYYSSEMFEEHLTSTSHSGRLMRSKGELFIASRLDYYRIPARYEEPLWIPELSQYSPDFTIRRPRDHKIFYWEHFGMVDDPEYLRRSRYKLSRYEEYGIVPWDNLIITYNGYDGSINGKLIDAMIQGWLL